MVEIEHHEARIGRVENEVQTIRTDLGGLKADVSSLTGDVRALGGILGRIEQGVAKAQEHSEAKEQASRPSVVALVGIIVTIMSMMVGGAWLISGSLATLQERSIRRDMEMEVIRGSITRIEDSALIGERGDRDREARSQ